MRRRVAWLALVAAFAGAAYVMLRTRTIDANGVERVAVVDEAPSMQIAEPADDTSLPTDLVPRDTVSRNDTHPVAAPSPDREARIAHVDVLLVAKEDGAALPGWRVQCARRGGAHPRLVPGSRGRLGESVLTDAAGRASLDVESSVALVLTATSEGSARLGRTVTLDVGPLAAGTTQELRVDVVTAVDRTVLVRVLERETRAPIAGCRVDAYSAPRSATARGRSAFHLPPPAGTGPVDAPRALQAVTDAAGTCSFTLSSALDTYLDLEAAGFGRAFATVDTSDAASECEVLLSRSARLRVHVLGGAGGRLELQAESWSSIAQDGHPIAAAWAADLRWSGTVDAAERVEISGLPARCTLEATFVLPDRVPWKLGEIAPFAPGETRDVTWDVAGTCTVRGRVVDDARAPVAACDVWIVAQERGSNPYVFQAYEDDDVVARARTETDGTFVIEGVRAGSWWIGVVSDDSPRASTSSAGDVASLCEALVLEPGERSHEVLLRVDRGLYVSGKIETPAGGSPEHAYVRATSGGGDSRFADAGNAGSFRVGPLLRGTYRLTAAGTGFAESSSVEVEAGTTNVVLRLRSGGSIAGSVRDESGNAGVFSVRILPSRECEIEASSYGLQTMPDGTFERSGLSSCEYDVVAFGGKEGIACLRGVVVAAGTVNEIDLRLDRGARLRVRSSDANRRIHVRSERVIVATLSCGPNAERSCIVPAGRTRVELVQFRRIDGGWATDVVASRELELQPGESMEIELEPPN